MCLFPSQILNPSRWHKVGSGQPMYISIPCGHCSECISVYQSEWRLRSMYEAMSASNFVLFDTLTYSPNNLPHLSDLFSVPSSCDFSCFSKTDIQLFFKRLRKKLTHLGFPCSDKLRYLVCSEYGSDNTYVINGVVRRGTLRPHYHVLFFCSFDINPLELSKCVSDCWYLGRTDGVKYRGSSYVSNRCVFRGSDSINPVLGYVTKYISKSFSYASIVNKRLEKLKTLDFDTYLYCKPYVRQFHLQSRGFGYNYLILGKDCQYFIDNPLLPVRDKQHQTKYVNLPKSLVRKLFYKFEHVGSHVFWRAKSELLTYKLRVSSSAIDRLAHRYFDFLLTDFNRCRQLAELSLFAHNRYLSSYSSPYESLVYSFNISDGLRNYCVHDKGYLSKKPVFTNKEFGDLIDGFSLVPTLKYGDSFVDDNVMHSVDNIKQYSYFDNAVDSILQEIYNSNQRSGDKRIKVLKKLEQLYNLFKT